jgi:hypothetical protein
LAGGRLLAEQTVAAEAMATATAVAQSSTATAVVAITQTAEQTILEQIAANQATATADAAVLAQTMQAQEARLAATATAQAATAQAILTREAEAFVCLRSENYGLTFLDTANPTLVPPAPAYYVLGNTPPRTIEASWRVLNSGVCPWQGITWRTVEGRNLIGEVARLEVRQNGVVVTEVAPQSEATFVLLFDRPVDTQGLQQEWSLLVQQGDSLMSLLDLPRFSLDTQTTVWFQMLSPSPTPTATFTPTPTPIPTNTPEPPPPPPPPPTNGGGENPTQEPTRPSRP